MSYKESLCTKKKLIAILTAMTLVLSGIPFSFLSLSERVYANGEGPATVAEAAAALKAAKDEEAAAQYEDSFLES
jgi:hypothetical protein